jgi:hypothetical protein
MLLSYLKTDGSRSTIRVTATQKELIKYICEEYANVSISTKDYLTNLYSIYVKKKYKYSFSRYVLDVLFDDYLKLLKETNNAPF